MLTYRERYRKFLEDAKTAFAEIPDFKEWNAEVAAKKRTEKVDAVRTEKLNWLESFDREGAERLGTITSEIKAKRFPLRNSPNENERVLGGLEYNTAAQVALGIPGYPVALLSEAIEAGRVDFASGLVDIVSASRRGTEGIEAAEFKNMVRKLEESIGVASLREEARETQKVMSFLPEARFQVETAFTASSAQLRNHLNRIPGTISTARPS